MEYLSEKLLTVGISVDPETVRSARDTPSEDALLPIQPPHVSLPPLTRSSALVPKPQCTAPKNLHGIRLSQAGAMSKSVEWLEVSWCIRISPSKLGTSPVFSVLSHRLLAKTHRRRYFSF